MINYELSNPFRTALTLTDFTSADTALVQSKFVEVGRFVVPAGVGYSLGYGQANGQDSAQGRIYGELKDTGAAAVAGVFRIALLDAKEQPIRTLFEARCESLTTSATDRQQQMPLAEHEAVAVEDRIIALYIKCADAAKTLDVSASTLRIDMTEYSVH